jgi:hypothetical protein
MTEYAINTGRPTKSGADTYVRRAHCATSDVARIKRFKTARAAEDFLRKHRDDVLLFRARIVAAPAAGSAAQP